MVTGECFRISRRVQTREQYDNEVKFFSKKLQERGYSSSFLKRFRLSYDQIESRHRHRPKEIPKVTKLYLKVKYGRSFPEKPIRKHLKRAEQALSKRFGVHIRCFLCWQTSKNLFRRYYKLAWSRQSLQRVDRKE